MGSETEFYLSEDAARRVSGAVRAVERMTGPPDPGRRPPIVNVPTRYAVVTQAITASGSGLLGVGKGVLQLVKATTSGGTTTYAHAALPAWTQPVVILSGASSVIAVGRLIIVVPIDGFYNVIVDFC